MPSLVSPSVLSANFGRLNDDITMLNASSADWIHCDIMDGQFVPNLSFGLPVLEAIHQVATKPLDVHLMVLEPDRYFEAFVKAGASILHVHAEATRHLHRSLQAIRSLGIQAGVVLNPGSPLELVADVLDLADVVLLMSVNPGFGGQKFIPQTVGRVQRLRQMIDAGGHKTLIEIDGGVTDQNASALRQAGADVLVAGSYVFAATDPHQAIDSLR